MLFDNYKPYEIPDKGEYSREVLKTAFPEFYQGKVVKIHALEHTWTSSKMVNGDKMSVGVRRDPPKPTGHKAQANLIIGGKQVNLQYSDIMPSMNDKGATTFTYPANQLIIKNGFQISYEKNQEDLLYFLYFTASYISNSFKPGRTPQYEFVKPEVKAAERIEAFKKATAYEQRILIDLSNAQIEYALKGLGMNVVDNSDMNRVALLDKVKRGGDMVRQTFEELVSSVKENGSEMNVSDVVQKLIDDGTIKYEDGGWVQRSKIKPDEYNKTPFYNKKSADYDESRLSLIEHLKINTTLLDKLKS
jgi:hypothetical protein